MIRRAGTRILLPCLVGGLALSALTAGCGSSSTSASSSSSSKPSYCAAGQQLKTSVQDLGKGSVATGGTSSVQTALNNVGTSAKKFESDANGAFSSQTTAFRNALTGLQSAIKSLHGQSPTAALKALASQGAKLKTAATNLESTWSAKCG